MTKEAAIAQYENKILKNSKYRFPGEKYEVEQAVLHIIKYVIEELLELTPEEAYTRLNKNILDETHLSSLIESYIKIPKDIDIYNDFDFLLTKIYPEKISYNPYEKMITLYNKILSGEKPKFPKNYFSAENGKEKAEYLLLYCIDKNIPLSGDSSTYDLYNLFHNTRKINAKLKEWKIKDVQERISISPLAFLHDALPENVRNDFFYYYFSFKQVYDAQKA